MIVLGIHDGHNAAACLLKDGAILGAVQEERFTRLKNQPGFPARSVAWLLEAAHLGPAQVDCVAMNGLETPSQLTRDEILICFGRVDHWKTQVRRRLPPRLFGTPEQRSQARLAPLAKLGLGAARVERVEHHAAHAAATFFGSGWTDAPVLVLTCDASGDGLCATVSVGEHGRLRRLAEIPDEHSFGNIYSMATFLMGMAPSEHEYKLMGLAPYASERATQEARRRFAPLIEFPPDMPLGWRKAAGCPHTYFSYKFFRRLTERLRFDALAAGLQRFTEECLARWVSSCVRHTGVHRLALSGGVFMNVKANQAIGALEDVEHLYVCPSCGDESNAIGAAYHAFVNGAVPSTVAPPVQPLGPLYLGPDFCDGECEAALLAAAAGGAAITWERVADIERRVAELLVEGHVVGRFKGRMEFGARALGNRSLLADPARREVVRTLNAMIKSRDFWMPFAPSILEERAGDYLVNPKGFDGPHMMLAFETTERRADLPAAIHPYDDTARPQVVYRAWNPDYHRLLKEFERLTGRGAILNTSFNLHGEPIVGSPTDAIATTMASHLQWLALGSFLVSKTG